MSISTMQHDTESPLEWRDGQPLSARYGDVYFSRDSGIAETRHVFLRHNRLAERWQALARPLFTIAETGFGTGLNFLCAWHLWRETAPATARLHFVSTEKYPLKQADLARALALWPELAALRDALLAQYQGLVPGWQRLGFDGGRVTLTLLVGDARDTLPQLRAAVDAWFLDGFAPAKNPDLWQPELFREIARLSAPGATFATFTSAGVVKRGLQAAGFHVEKVPGFGRKRDMLRGELPPASGACPGRERRAVVIGGGIAGAASAHSLARRGWQVTLLERHATLAEEASGNPQGVLYPRLSGHDIALGRLALNGFLHTRGLLEEIAECGRDWDACGLLQLAFDAREAKRCAEVLARRLPPELVRGVDAAEASALAGVALPHGGLYFAQGGWVHPPALCRLLAAHPGIELRHDVEAVRLERHDGIWQAWGEHACLASAPVVVVCGASDSLHFQQSAHLPLAPVRGQLSLLPATPASAELRAVVCTDGYIGPARQGQHSLGATFHPRDPDPLPRAQDHAANLATLRTLSPALYAALGGEALAGRPLAGRVAWRSVAPDRLPLAGPLLDAEAVLRRHAAGTLDARQLPWLPGLHVNTGHGSKGMLSAPLAAELIAALLEREPLPVDAGLARALDPNRFLLRQHGLKPLVGAMVDAPLTS